MNIFKNNNKTALFVLSFGVLLLIVLLLFTNIFSYNKISTPQQKSAEILKIEKQSNDTSLEAIEADLKATDLSDIDKELNDIEKQINAEI